MILSRFQWYRRARGGYWAQVTDPIGIVFKRKWIRCNRDRPTPDREWTFYPWATKTLGNGYIDEWHSVEPCWAVPLSSVCSEMLRALKFIADRESSETIIGAVARDAIAQAEGKPRPTVPVTQL